MAAKLTGVEFGRKRYNLQRILDFLKFAVAAFHPLPFGHPPPREGVLKGADEFKTAREIEICVSILTHSMVLDKGA